MALPGGMHGFTLGSLLAFIVGLIFHVVGLATVRWSVTRDYIGSEPLGEAGLFLICARGTCISYSDSSTEVKVCEAFALLGIFAALSALAISVYHILKPRLGREQTIKLPQAVLADSGVAFVSIIICVIIWAAAVHDSSQFTLGYSFDLSIIASFLFLGGGMEFYFIARRHSSYSTLPK